jgi:hypothetical protein
MGPKPDSDTRAIDRKVISLLHRMIVIMWG